MRNSKDIQHFLEDMGYNVGGVFLIGSQNYRLNTNLSDKDYKAIIAPTLEDIVMNKKPISKVIEYENGQIDVKDIRIFAKCLKKMNPQYLECLFSIDYSIPDKNIERLVDKEVAEKIAHSHESTFYAAVRGMMMQKLENLTKDTPTQESEIMKYGWCGKQLHHILRLFHFVVRYINTADFQTCLVPPDDKISDLIALKNHIGKYENKILYDADWATRVAKIYIKYASEEMSSCYIGKREDMDSFIDQVAYDYIKAALRKEITK